MKLTIRLFILANLCWWFGCANSKQLAPSFFIHLYYKTQNGDDLLNPVTNGNYSKDGIQITDIVTKNGVATEVTTPVDSCDNYVCQSAKTNLYYIQFSPDRYYGGTLIHHGSAIDTLEYSKLQLTGMYGYVIDRVLYRGQILWSRSPSKPYNNLSVTIIK